MKISAFDIQLPEWLTVKIDANKIPPPALGDRMGLAIKASQKKT